MVGPAVRLYNPPKERREQTDETYQVVSSDLVHQPDMKVLLIDTVPGLGAAGDLVFVRPNRFRVQLYPSGYATYASPFNIAYYKDLIENSSSRADRPSSKISPITIDWLKKRRFLIDMNQWNPWTIEKWHVRIGFRRGGFVVPDHAIELPETPIVGPDLDLEMKEFAVFITINKQERLPVRCVIHHIGVPLKDFWFRLRRKPILADQKELIDSLPKIEEIEEKEEAEEDF